MCAEDPLCDLSRQVSSVKCVFFLATSGFARCYRWVKKCLLWLSFPFTLSCHQICRRVLHFISLIWCAIVNCKAKIFESSDKRKIIVAGGWVFNPSHFERALQVVVSHRFSITWCTCNMFYTCTFVYVYMYYKLFMCFILMHLIALVMCMYSMEISIVFWSWSKVVSGIQSSNWL